MRAPQHVNGSSKYIQSGIKSPLLRNAVVKNSPSTHPLSLDPQDCIKQNNAHKNIDPTQKPNNKKVTLHLYTHHWETVAETTLKPYKQNAVQYSK